MRTEVRGSRNPVQTRWMRSCRKVRVMEGKAGGGGVQRRGKEGDREVNGLFRQNFKGTGNDLILKCGHRSRYN